MPQQQSVLPTQPTARRCPFDPPEEYREIRERTPIARMMLPDGLVGTVVTGYDQVRAVLTDPRFGANRRQGRPGDTITDHNAPPPQRSPGVFIMMDAPEHTRFRRLLTGKFTVRRMRQLAPMIERFASERLDAMERADGPVDLVREYALPIPSLVICELLGVPYADRDDFQRNSSTMVDLDSSNELVQKAHAETARYIYGLVQAKHAHPTDDLLSDLVTSGELTDEELTGVGLLLLVAGHETTANMIALSTMCLLANPGQLARLRRDPALIDGAVEELLRYLTILQFGMRRTAREDIELDGVHIPAGSTVVVVLSAANRSPEHFPGDPDKLEIDREYGPHLAFGHGIHQCLGQQLARVELKVALTALFERFPNLRLELPVSEVPMRDSSIAYGPRELQVSW
ncbi:cytochrome P450 [Spirillospora sp. CA-255316]